MFLLPSHVRIFFVAPCRDSSLSNVYIQQAPVAAPKEQRQSTDVAGASASDYKPAKTPRRKAISAPRNSNSTERFILRYQPVVKEMQTALDNYSPASPPLLFVYISADDS